MDRLEGTAGEDGWGSDIDDAELVQLRRACRLLEVGANRLNHGYYTVVIEPAFVANERTIQLRMIHDGVMSPEEGFSSHRRLYQPGVRVGLYDDAFGDDLAELWDRNQTKTYYRLAAVADVHRHLINMSRVSHKCLCWE